MRQQRNSNLASCGLVATFAVAAERATSAEIVEIAPERKRARSFNAQGRLELVQGYWADRERERLVGAW